MTAAERLAYKVLPSGGGGFRWGVEARGRPSARSPTDIPPTPALPRKGRAIAYGASPSSTGDWDRHRACFDKLSMRFFFRPRRFPLILSLSKDARQFFITRICDSPARKGGGRIPICAAATLAIAVLCSLTASAAAAPQRIASIYLCSDQLLLRLADRERIVSVNRFAADPSFSNEAGAVGGIKLNRGRAEEILPLNPDLVIAGVFTAPATKALLRRLGIAVLELPVEEDFDGIRANIRRVAKALGEDARGEQLVAALDRSLPPPPPADAWRPELMLYRFGGYSQGRNTLTHAIFERAGFANYAASRLDGVGQLPLEKIVGDPPDAILLGDDGAERNSLAAEALAHPALRMLESTLPTLLVPDRLWLCGLANTGEAVRRLAAFRASLPDRPR